MSRLRLSAIVALVFVLQIALFTKARLFGVHPDLFLPFALAVGMTGGRNRGAVAGFCAGLITDAFLLTPLGLSALMFAIAGYGAGAFSEDTSGAPYVAALIAAGSASVAFVLYVIGAVAIGDLTITIGHAVTVTLVEAMGAAIIAPVFAWILKDAWRTKVEAW